jgi:hypothetical protein
MHFKLYNKYNNYSKLFSHLATAVSCQTGYYSASGLCWPCPVQCAACTNGVTCSSCVGTTSQPLARVSAQTCQCPTKSFDNIVNSATTVSCLISCPNGYLQTPNQCILGACA